jgi:prephenate dehydratase
MERLSPKNKIKELLINNSIIQAVQMVDKLRYDLGVMAGENSTDGGVMETLKELVRAKQTTLAAEMVKTTPGAAAIGSRSAAERNQLSILKENIGDNPKNSTRFFLIGRGETQPTGKDTTTLIFTVEDRVGILADCLLVFKHHGINLTKIDSHPTGKIGEYMFLVFLDGHQRNEVLLRAFGELEERGKRTWHHQ